MGSSSRSTPDVRQIVKDRADRRCERCGRYIRDGDLASIHHRVRRSQGGADVPANLVLLDGSGTTGCHGWVHANPTKAMREGFLVPGWEDPTDVPIMTSRGWALIDVTYGWADREPSKPKTVQEILRELEATE